MFNFLWTRILLNNTAPLQMRRTQKRSPEHLLLSTAVQAMQAATGLAARALPSDGLVTIGGPGTSWSFTAEVRSTITPAVLALVLGRPHPRRPPQLLVARYINEELGARLRERGIHYIDTLGNAWIRRPGLVVHVQGRRLPATAPAGPRGRIHSRAAIQVIFPLLAHPGLVAAPLRDLAHLAQVSLGSADLILQELRSRGFVEGDRRHRRLVNKEALVEEWVGAFTSRLRPRLVLGRFRAIQPDWFERTDIARHGAQWSGEAAAARLDLLKNPQTVVIYADELPKRLIIEARLARDPAGSIEVIRRFWSDTVDGRQPLAIERDPALAPFLLVYADLLAVGSDRVREVAQLLREKKMASCL